MNDGKAFLKPEWYSDYLLVQQVLEGNIKVWDKLYRTTYPLVYNYVKKVRNKWLISLNEVEDVVSEAFKRCYLKLSSYRGRSRFSTWVCGFCRYILLSYYHKYSLRNKYMMDTYNLLQSQYNYRNPENIVIEKERNLCIWTAFNSLTFHHQILLECYVLNGLNSGHMKIIKKLDAKITNNELDVAINTLRNRFIALYEKTY